MTVIKNQQAIGGQDDADSLWISRELPPKKIEYRLGDCHLVLRPFEVSDRVEFQKSLESTLPALRQFMIWPCREWNPKECLLWLKNSHGNYFLSEEFEWGIFDGLTGVLLGSVGIIPASLYNPNSYEIGYWISQEYMGRGIATLASRIIILISFKYLNISRLQVTSLRENTASIRVIEKCGFRFEGALRGLFSPVLERVENQSQQSIDNLYALLPEDCEQLSWYSLLVNSINITSLNNQTFGLS